MIYLFIFFISIFFIVLGLNQKNRKIGLVLELIGLLIPCILAGVRSTDVGTDTSGYPLSLYNFVSEGYSFNQLVDFSNMWYLSADKVYLFITYIVAHNNLSFQFYLFIIEVLIIFPYYISLKINNKNNNNSIIFGMFLFFLAFYNLSLNMIRQSIAISFVILSFTIFKNKDIKNNKKRVFISLLLFCIAYGFHNTTLFCLPFYFLYSYFEKKDRKLKNKQFVNILICLFFSSLPVFYKPILTFIGNFGLYNKVSLYLDKYTNFDIDFLGTFVNLVIIFIIMNNKKIIQKSNQNYIFVVTLAFCNLFLSFLGAFVTYTQRVAYYLYFILLNNYIPLQFNTFNLDEEETKSNVKIIRFITVIIFLLYWFIVILMNNSGETLPYQIFK